MKPRTIFPLPKGVHFETAAVSDGFRNLRRSMKPLKLNGCIRIIAGGSVKSRGVRYVEDGKAIRNPATRTREYRLCSIGGVGEPAQLQLIAVPRKGRKNDDWIIGTTQKACRLSSWPTIMYAEDHPRAASMPGLLGGARRRRR